MASNLCRSSASKIDRSGDGTECLQRRQGRQSGKPRFAALIACLAETARCRRVTSGTIIYPLHSSWLLHEAHASHCKFGPPFSIARNGDRSNGAALKGDWRGAYVKDHAGHRH